MPMHQFSDEQMSDEDRQDFQRQLHRLCAEYVQAQGLRLIPREPPGMLLVAMGEVTRGKKKKAEYLMALYRAVYNHFPSE